VYRFLGAGLKCLQARQGFLEMLFGLCASMLFARQFGLEYSDGMTEGFRVLRGAWRLPFGEGRHAQGEGGLIRQAQIRGLS
jgi:hypothetical protein